MSIAYSHFGNPGHKIHLQSMNLNYNGGRHGQDQTKRQYLLPPPHSSIPIGLIVDNDREESEPRSQKRACLSYSRHDNTPSREQLPSVHQLLSSSENSASYLPPPTPPPSQTGHYQGHCLQNSPSIYSLSSDSHLSTSGNPERISSSYPSMPPRGMEYEPYHAPQPARLPSLSQVGIEPSPHASISENSRVRLVPDEDSPQIQYATSGDFAISPTQSVRSTSSHLMQHLRQESAPASQGSPAVPHQVVDERYLPGKGICYIFADNSYCPKLIDGQPVNPNWGLTKAGKARKRLAQACIPCREKKVKCQPNLPKCDQCQKSGRECRFESPRSIRGRSSSCDLQLV